MSLTLAIDTSGRGGSAVLALPGQSPLARADHHASQGNAESLFGLFDELLRAAGHDKRDIERVAIVQGPGSFTGLRIGIMTAKGLAYSLGCELWSAPTMQLLRAGASGPCVALVGAGRGFAFADGGAQEEGAAERMDVAAIAALLERSDAAQLRYSMSDGVAPVLAGDPKLGEVEAVAVDLAAELASLTARGVAPARRSELAGLLPLYLAPSQAERTHGIDLSDAVHTPEPPESWG